MKPAAFRYSRARCLDEALEALAASKADAKVLAGGQSLGPMLNLRLARPQSLIDIRHVAELRACSADTRLFSLGATITHAEIEDRAIEDFTRGFLPFVARSIAYRAIRNRGTVGGSLAHCDPAADWVSTMAALDATLVVNSNISGVRRLAADQFLVGAFTPQLSATEIIAAVEVRRLSAEARWGYHKVCRKTGEFARAIGIAVTDPQTGFCRVIGGAVEGRPVILSDAADALKSDGVERAAEVASEEISTRLAHLSPPHRQQVSVAVRRSLHQMARQ
jgi:carbon-monoxide dehydrogenase medium subunit